MYSNTTGGTTMKTMLEIMTSQEGYCNRHTDNPSHLQKKAKTLCWEYNQTSPDDTERRAEILQELFGDCHPLTFIEPSFHCDYGFNIHTQSASSKHPAIPGYPKEYQTDRPRRADNRSVLPPDHGEPYAVWCETLP